MRNIFIYVTAKGKGESSIFMEENTLEMEKYQNFKENFLSLHSFEIALPGVMGMKEGQTHTQRSWDQMGRALKS